MLFKSFLLSINWFSIGTASKKNKQYDSKALKNMLISRHFYLNIFYEMKYEMFLSWNCKFSRHGTCFGCVYGFLLFCLFYLCLFICSKFWHIPTFLMWTNILWLCFNGIQTFKIDKLQVTFIFTIMHQLKLSNTTFFIYLSNIA